MAEYVESICRRCFHSYVCEQFNEHRDSNNEKCHFYNDHFVPAADVAPVVHAEWVVCGDGEDVPWVCSHCGKTTAHKYKTMYGKYCPSCGAKMDGE